MCPPHARLQPRLLPLPHSPPPMPAHSEGLKRSVGGEEPRYKICTKPIHCIAQPVEPGRGVPGARKSRWRQRAQGKGVISLLVSSNTLPFHKTEHFLNLSKGSFKKMRLFLLALNTEYSLSKNCLLPRAAFQRAFLAHGGPGHGNCPENRCALHCALSPPPVP